MSNFPGNPYGPPYSGTISKDAAVITNAIRCLAFEIRTANILESAKPLELKGQVDVGEVIGKLAEAGKRMGYDGNVKANGQVVPKSEDEPKRIVITLPDDPDLDAAGREDLTSRLLDAVERAQGVYPAAVQ